MRVSALSDVFELQVYWLLCVGGHTVLLSSANVTVKTRLFVTNKKPTQEDGKLIRENVSRPDRLGFVQPA